MIVIDIEIEGNLESDFNNIKNNIQKDINDSTKVIGAAILKKAEDLAQQHLPGKLANMYKTSLKLEQISENMVVLELDEKMLWLDKGRKSGFMDELLKSGAKTSKDGFKYRVIPMKSQEKSQNTPTTSFGENLVSDLKNFLKNKNIKTEKNNNLELDSKGSPRIGRVHSFDIKNIRDKKQISDNIKRISVFQNKNPKSGKIEKSIMAFRVISEKHKEKGKWFHPGTPSVKILEKVFKYSEQLWQTEIFPAIKAKYEGQ
jgi:hypothetical protein